MADGKRYFWLKLYEDFFSSKRIKKLRALAGGDTYTIIYLKMQLKALKTDGYLYFDGIMNDFAEELALDIDESVDDVKVTINYLLSVGLIECNESTDEYCLTYMQNVIGSESASSQRSRECRARKKNKEALQCNNDATDTQRICNKMQQVANVEKEIEKEIDIELEKEKENKELSKDNSSFHKDVELCQYQWLIDDWNSLSVYGISKLSRIGTTGSRVRLLKARIKEYGKDGFVKAIDNVRKSKFLQGKNKRGWQITFDWMIKPDNFVKVIEGNYTDKDNGGVNDIEREVDSWL